MYLGNREIERLPRLLYRVLRCLGQNAGQLVKREALVEAWPEIERADGITEAMIDQVIRRLRKTLGDEASQPTYLETRRGLGYIMRHTIYIPAKDQ